MRRRGPTPEEELQELQQKFALLEGDRKAYYETSQWTIKQNRETLAAVKAESKELKAELVERHGQKSSASTDAAELSRLSSYVSDLRKRHDQTFQLGNAKEAALQSRVDSVKELELDGVKLAEGDTPVTQRIRGLEEKLQGTQERVEEVLAQRKTYEQIAKRLREDRNGLDPQLHSLERSLTAKTRDVEELIRLSHDAAHAKDTAKAELARVEERLAGDRQLRERQLCDRQALWLVKQDMAASADAARATTAALAAAREAEREPRTSAASAFPDSIRVSDQDGMSFEMALRKVKEATGVSEVEEVIKKFSSQKDTAKNLAAMTQEAQARIDALAERIESSKGRLEQLRYSGDAPAPGRRASAVLDELEGQLSEALARQERVARLLVSVRAGAEHLAEQLEAVITPNAPSPPPADPAAAALGQCQARLSYALRELRSEEAVLHTALADPVKLAALAFPAAEESRALLQTLRMDHLQVAEDEEADEGADEDGEGPDEVMDRSTVKGASERRTKLSKAPIGTLRKPGAR